MIEIKFRAWDSENNKWIYGWVTKLTEGVRRFWAIIQDEDGELVRYYIHNENSIGQFTGLYDKKGKEIFEGDIVDFLFDGIKFRLPVVWDRLNVQYNLHRTDIQISYEFKRCADVGVVGNIYENTELVEVNNDRL